MTKKYYEEQEKQDIFQDKLGAERADRLQYLWNNSYESKPFMLSKGKSREEVFTEKAKSAGFKKSEIKMFQQL